MIIAQKVQTDIAEVSILVFQLSFISHQLISVPTEDSPMFLRFLKFILVAACIILPITTAAQPLDDSLIYGHWMSCDKDDVITREGKFPEAWYESFFEDGLNVGIWLGRSNPEVSINQWEIRYESGYPEILLIGIDGGREERLRIASLSRSMISFHDSEHSSGSSFSICRLESSAESIHTPAIHVLNYIFGSAIAGVYHSIDSVYFPDGRDIGILPFIQDLFTLSRRPGNPDIIVFRHEEIIGFPLIRNDQRFLWRISENVAVLLLTEEIPVSEIARSTFRQCCD